jgi:hypothetical protein
MFPIEPHTIFLALAGSQAHGTAREGSDVDVRGVCVAPHEVRVSLYRHFEQYEGALPTAFDAVLHARMSDRPSAQRALSVKSECVIFDVAKFVGLCAQANPNGLEILFADERDWIVETPAWRRLHRERARFLTKRVQQTFHGYAMAQLRKIETHRSWLLSPPTKKPSREDFALPVAGALSGDDQNRIEASIADKIRGYGVDDVEMPKATRVEVQERMRAFMRDMLAAGDAIEERTRAVASHALSLPIGVVSALNAEKKYRAAMKHWEAYLSWKEHRNPARAVLEREHGYDTKHAMHLIRLMRMGIEALETGELSVRRNDAAELSAIRDGALSFEALRGLATTLQVSMEQAAMSTTLPDDVDHDAVDALLAELLATALR